MYRESIALLPLRLPQAKLKAFFTALAAENSFIIKNVSTFKAAVVSPEALAYAHGRSRSCRHSPSIDVSPKGRTCTTCLGL